MSSSIEDYGLIGNGETAALVHRGGSIDWLCLPRFDSDACFAALLGRADNGRWIISPVEPAKLSRRYVGDTLVLETEFATSSGAVVMTDFMAIQENNPILLRMLRGVRGQVTIRSEVGLRFDYGSLTPWIELDGRQALARVGPDVVALHAPSDLHRDGDMLVCEITLDEADQCSFAMVYGSATSPPSPPPDCGRALSQTLDYWQHWIGRFQKHTEWPDAVRRALLTLKALIYRPTGGMIAAATTSLPERSGEGANWDYRYCWIRDAAFTLVALIDAGYMTEATSWREWVLRAAAGTPEKMRILYRIDGSRRVEEWEADWLPGYRWTPPVRIGNAAAAQRQLDIYGELIDCIHTAATNGIERSSHERELIEGVVAHVEAVWRLPDHGLWETRGEPRHFVYSKVSAWVAVDRYIRYRKAFDSTEDTKLLRLRRLRQDMHDEICHDGYVPGLGHFVEYFGSDALDASLLLLPLVGFLPVEDERIAGTIAAIEKHLVIDGLVHRKKPRERHPEGAFLACSCWLADCQLLQGRAGDARRTFDRVLAASNDLGLLAEEYDVDARRLAGNFPQALSHLAVIRTALRFAGDVTERGGGCARP